MVKLIPVNQLTQIGQVGQRWQRASAPLTQFFAQLSRRDQLALSGLIGFLCLFALGLGGWSLHEKANASQKAYTNTVADVFWLRSQAGNINTAQSAPMGNHADSVRQVMAQSGITATVVDNNGSIQVSFGHPQAAVVSNVFGQLSQQGITIEQLQINQPTLEQLEVQAVLK